jgi:hypothetical protein
MSEVQTVDRGTIKILVDDIQKPENFIAVKILNTTPGSSNAQQLSWIVRGFFCNVCHYNLKGSVKRAEAINVAQGMAMSALDSRAISFDEYNSIMNEISEIETHVYPGCSLI